MNNTVYGRFGLAPSGDEIKLEWDEDLQDWNWTAQYIEDTMMDAYIPFAAFATAKARKRLLSHLLEVVREWGPDAAYHCDTDSVIYSGAPCQNIDYGDTLGTWGLESRPEVLIEAGFKRYIELRRYPMRAFSDLIGMACAGVPQKMDHSESYPVGMWVEILDDPMVILEDGHALGQEHYSIRSEWLRALYLEHGQDPDDVNTLKLMPKKVPGGVILEGRQHKLNDNLVWRLRR